MDKLEAYLVREIERIDEQIVRYQDQDGPVYRGFLEGKVASLVDILGFLNNRLSPEGDSMEPKLRELVDAQEKHIDRQDALIEKQEAFIASLLKGGK
jgi:hypothetical protein